MGKKDAREEGGYALREFKRGVSGDRS